jgi:lysophospholipase L1-like esterase
MNRTVSSIVSALALGLGLEGGARLDEWARWGTSLGSTNAGIDDIIAIDSMGARGIPGASYRQFTLNSLGLRGPEPHGDRARVLVLGASETFGLYEAAGKEYPRQLQDSLAAAGCVVDVMNAGLPGFSLPTLTTSFRNSLRALGAVTAIVYPTPVQYLEVARPVFVPPPHAAAPRTSRAPTLRVARRLRDHLKLLLPDRVKTMLRQREITAQRQQLGGATPWSAVPPERLTAFADDLSALVDTLRASGVTPVLVTHANAFPPGAPPDPTRAIAWGKFYPRAAATLLPVFDSAANVEVRALARREHIALSDAATAFAGRDVTTHFADFSHFTAVGSAIMAGRIARDVLATVGCPALVRRDSASRL